MASLHGRQNSSGVGESNKCFFIPKMATFSLQGQRVIILVLNLRGATRIEIRRQLSETCGDGVLNVKNVKSDVSFKFIV
jgi:hypothetical protein